MKQSNISIVKEILKASEGKKATKDLIAEIQKRISVSSNYARVMLSHANKAQGTSPGKSPSKKILAIKKVVEAKIQEATLSDQAFEQAKEADPELKLSAEEFNKQRAIFANLFGAL